MALSAAHDLLTAERWESADLEDVVRLAINAVRGAAAARASRSRGPACGCRRAHALGLAMALHELGSNAAKYGALLGRRRAGARSPGRSSPAATVRFVWEERDGPAVRRRCAAASVRG